MAVPSQVVLLVVGQAGAGAGESRERVGRGDRAVDAELARVRELWRKASQAEGV